MCGRFIRTSPLEAIRATFAAAGGDVVLSPRYNVCPGEEILAVVQAETERRLGWLTWAPYINARAETVAERPAFRRAIRRRRCLVPADGFYEWQRIGNRKVPCLFQLRPPGPFAFAALWERRTTPAGKPILSCSILTTTPNAIVAPVHDRMPVILAADGHTRWLDPTITDPAALRDLLAPYSADAMQVHPVRTLVNSPRNDSAECVVPATYE